MYVMIVSRGIPSEKYKMHGIFEYDQAKALALMGCKVVFAVVDIRSIRRWRKWGLERYDRDGVHVFRVNIPGGRLPASIQNWLIRSGIRILYRMVEREFGKPDIIHSHFTQYGYATVSLRKYFPFPLVLTEHSSLLMKKTLEKKVKRMAAKAYSLSDTVISVSPALAKVLEENFEVKSLYIPNIVDTSTFSFVPEHQNEDHFCFVSVGNLIERKRMDLTIEAFAEAFGNTPDVSLCIFGDGPEKEKLEKLIISLGQKDKIALKGFQTRDVIAEKMKFCNCFVLSSRQETFGVVYIEAMASGLPVIATRCGGPEHFINERNGVLVAVDDKKALIEAMRYIYGNFRRFDRNEIAVNAKIFFSPETIGQELMELYSKLIS